MPGSCVSFYPCVSLARTAEFYGRTLGLRLAHTEPGVCIYSCGAGYWGFVEYEDRAAAAGRLCLSLNCASEAEVDREYDRLCAMGVTPETKPAVHARYGVYSFFLRDPNGYTVEYQKVRGLDL